MHFSNVKCTSLQSELKEINPKRSQIVFDITFYSLLRSDRQKSCYFKPSNSIKLFQAVFSKGAALRLVKLCQLMKTLIHSASFFRAIPFEIMRRGWKGGGLKKLKSIWGGGICEKICGGGGSAKN